MARSEKLAGQRVVKARKAPKKASPAEKPAASGVAATCDAIERYLDRLLAAELPGLDVQEQILAPQKASAVDAAEKKLGAPFPADVRAFLLRGLRHPSGDSGGEPFFSLGFDFLPADKVVKSTAMLRDASKGRDDAHAALVRSGVALTWSEPQLVVAPDGVYHFSYRNPLLRVAASWSEFLEHWLTAGCFASHSFDALWKKVQRLVESEIPPSRNAWVRAYEKHHPKR